MYISNKRLETLMQCAMPMCYVQCAMPMCYVQCAMRGVTKETTERQQRDKRQNDVNGRWGDTNGERKEHRPIHSAYPPSVHD